MRVPYVDIAGQHAELREELLCAVGRVIDRGQFVLGEEVAAFERQFSDLCGCGYAVGVNSGTDALVLSLRALGVGAGDEVITAPNSFVATASCIAMLGARPVFVDVRNDYNLDPAQLESAITPRTRAIIPVHLTGRPAEMDPILAIAKKYNLHVIEDCAQAVLASYRGKRVGSFGDTGCFSLHPLKTLNACGDGGVITTSRRELYEQLLLLRNLGLQSRENAVVWSGNSRLDTVQAAMLLVKMKPERLHAWTEARRAHAEAYRTLLERVQRVRTPSALPHEWPVYHTFVIEADRRDELKSYLAAEGIDTAVHYPRPIHLQDAARDLGYGPGSFPEAERQATRILSLPIYPELSADHLEYTACKVKSFYSQHKDAR